MSARRAGLVVLLAVTLSGCTNLPILVLARILGQLGVSTVVVQPPAGEFPVIVVPGNCVIFPNPLTPSDDDLLNPGGPWEEDDDFSLDRPPGWLSVQTSRSLEVGPVGVVQHTERRLCATGDAPLVENLHVPFTYVQRRVEFVDGIAVPQFLLFQGALRVSSSSTTPLTVVLTATPASVERFGDSLLHASVSGGTPPYAFRWREHPLLCSTEQCRVSSLLDTTTFEVRVTDSLGLTASASVTVTVGPGVSISKSPSQTNYDAGAAVQLIASVQGGTPPYIFSWTPATDIDDPTRQDPIVTPVTTTEYTVTVTDAQGLQGSDVTSVIIRPPFTVSAQASPATIFAGQSSQLLATPAGGLPQAFGWVGPGLSATDIPNPVATPSATTTYTVTVTDVLGRTAAASVTVTVTVASAADLAVTLTDSPDPVLNGRPLTYTMTVTNNGPGSATSVVLTDTIPATVTVGAVTPSQGSCQRAGVSLTCAVGSLASGGTATVTLETLPFVAGTLTNTATVTANESDPNPANNTATQVTTVLGF